MPADRREETDNGILETFGLSHEAEKVWRALIAEPSLDISAVARRLELTPEQARAAAGQLVRANLAREDNNGSTSTPYEPSLAVETLIARAERDLAAKHEKLRVVRSQLPQLSDTYARARSEHDSIADVEVVHSLEEVRERISLAGEKTKREHRHLMRDPKPESIRAATPIDLASLARGVHQRTIIGTGDLAKPDVYDALRDLSEVGEEIRSVPYVPTQLMIMDHDLAVVPRAPIDSSRGALFIRERTIIELMIYTFDHLWSTALPVFGADETLGAPAGRISRVLELMAAGVKDERIARTLGVASRTVRRDIAELKESLGATSRTEVVAAAVRQGWL